MTLSATFCSMTLSATFCHLPVSTIFGLKSEHSGLSLDWVPASDYATLLALKAHSEEALRIGPAFAFAPSSLLLKVVPENNETREFFLSRSLPKTEPSQLGNSSLPRSCTRLDLV
ncbi:hypothetical protein K438DRAFT_2055270 [Mycena galopus ATCC 62051]|nr:hypothetical protein K438DRAFT_2055270 [Mycena galopus ATCC 62051]